MAIIRLTKGYETIVDDDLYEELSSYKWYASGLEGRPARRLRAGPRKIIFLYHQVLHILPWVMSSLGFVVDHINNDSLDNQRSNLRVVSHKDNSRNNLFYGMRVGVAHDYTHNKYKAYIDRPDLPRINVGTYATEEEAHLALSQAKLELDICE